MHTVPTFLKTFLGCEYAHLRFETVYTLSLERLCIRSAENWIEIGGVSDGWRFVRLDACVHLKFGLSYLVILEVRYLEQISHYFESQKTQWVGLSGHRGARTPSYVYYLFNLQSSSSFLYIYPPVQIAYPPQQKSRTSA